MRADPALIARARAIIDVEVGSPNSIRDRAIIDDVLFERRISAIREVLEGSEARHL